MKKTPFRLTQSLLDFQNEILKNMDIPRTLFHRRAIDYFVKENGTINDRLFITKRSDPGYVKKDAIEQIYLDDEREEKIEKIAKQYHCKPTVVLFQILLDYCCIQAPIVLGNVETLYKREDQE